jgi:dTDP-4-dehydrorhamnose reductase
MRILVPGGGGQLAAAIVCELSVSHEVFAFRRADLDVTDDGAVERAVATVRPDLIVNCAAYNDVDGAEDHPVEALNVNAFAVRAMARAALAHGAGLVHFSTDFVFDGTSAEPYRETDPPNPRSAYAASKLLGEWFAADVPRAYVLRVESLFGRAPAGPEPKGSVAAIVRTLAAGGTARVFEDRTVSPTYIPDAARATRELVERAVPPGVYHCVNSGACTWLELGRAIADRLGLEGRLTPIRMADEPRRASRPRFCALSNEKLKQAGIAMPDWRDALDRYLPQCNQL